MDNRWAIRTLLFAARLGMAFQYQSVAAISPVIMGRDRRRSRRHRPHDQLYLAPGLAISLPGEIGQHTAVMLAGFVPARRCWWPRGANSSCLRTQLWAWSAAYRRVS